MKAVLDTKVHSDYNDEVTKHYHFPKRYSEILKQCLGDWVIFRQPRAAGGTKAYFATGLIREIIQDPASRAHQYALIEQFSPFDKLVQWRTSNRYAERTLREMPEISQIGVYLRGRSVRPLDDDDFCEIVEAGFGDTWARNEAGTGNAIDDAALNRLSDRWRERAGGRTRTVLACLTNRTLRDRAFRTLVSRAYEIRCAVSGLQLTDARGLSEVQAAHIVPVSEGGADIIQNGIALSATVHWLFDHHLIAIDEDWRVLVSPSISATAPLQLLGGIGSQITLPRNKGHHPSKRLIETHRREFLSLHGS